MREILFRGKRKDNGEWVEGMLTGKGEQVAQIGTCTDYGTHICVNSSYAVIPETIGQFTGLYDKNGKRIFEGDIVYCSIWEDYFEVQIKEGHFALTQDESADFSLFEEKMKYIEVKGNIHDNPELLKVQSNECELKPCPFCGGEAEITHGVEVPNKPKWFDVTCKTFSCRGNTLVCKYQSEQKAIDAWNRRANNE